jgi:dihydrofolate synthase/folylpolyglutamate synthase
VTPRARPPTSLLEDALELGAEADVHAGLGDAIACALRAASDGALVCVAGSLYLVGEARALLGSSSSPPSR